MLPARPDQTAVRLESSNFYGWPPKGLLPYTEANGITEKSTSQALQRYSRATGELIDKLTRTNRHKEVRNLGQLTTPQIHGA